MGRLGGVLDRLGAILGRLGAVLGRLGAALSRLGAAWGRQKAKRIKKESKSTGRRAMIAMAVGGRIKEGGSIFKAIFKGKMLDRARRKARRHDCRRLWAVLGRPGGQLSVFGGI